MQAKIRLNTTSTSSRIQNFTVLAFQIYEFKLKNCLTFGAGAGRGAPPCHNGLCAHAHLGMHCALTNFKQTPPL